MKRLYLIVGTLILAAAGIGMFYFYRHHATATAPVLPSLLKEKRGVRYVNIEEQVMDRLPLSNGDTEQAFTLDTRRNFRPMIDSLRQLWGTPDTTMDELYTDEYEYSSFYTWHKALLANNEPAELVLRLNYNSDYTSIYFAMYDLQTGLCINGRPAIWQQLTTLVKTCLFTQPEISKPEPVGREYPSFRLDELFKLDEAQLYRIFRNYIHQANKPVDIRFLVGVQGQIKDIIFSKESEKNVILPFPLDSFIHSFSYPVVIGKPAMDTLPYYVSWHLPVPQAIVLAASEGYLTRWDTLSGALETVIEAEGEHIPLSIEASMLNGSRLQCPPAPMHENSEAMGMSNTHAHAFIKLPGDSLFYMYTLVNGHWQKRQSYKTGFGSFHYDDLDGDGHVELLCYSEPDDSGHSEIDVFKYIPGEDKLTYSGRISSGYTIKPQAKETWISSGIYQDGRQEKKLLCWKHASLVTVKQARLELREIDSHTNYILSYYENPDWQQGKDTLVLKYKKLYNKKDRYQKRIWDRFFRIK